MKGFAQLIHQPLGYDPHNVMAIGIPLREDSYRTWSERVQPTLSNCERKSRRRPA